MLGWWIVVPLCGGAMVTNAKTLFDVNIQRAGYFLETHEDACDKPGRPVRRLDELPRAAVVFAIGSLDAYLCDVTAEALLTQLQAAPATATMTPTTAIDATKSICPIVNSAPTLPVVEAPR